ncbi:MAG: hypothetical protein DRH50_00210 [Deltaproteobacteria bacterium]|nr:MAG: hypothetical protein DRH50_00210 [Deltaproteobacteria bacterium]
MSKREKIILILMLLAIAYGAYNFLFISSSRTSDVNQKKELEDLKKFVTKLAQDTTKRDLSATNTYISLASSKWTKNPFLQSKFAIKPVTETHSNKVSAPEVILRYSGYLKVGDRMLAIINGMEYEEGEELEQEGYIIKSISPTRVVVGVAGQMESVIIPLEETGTFPVSGPREPQKGKNLNPEPGRLSQN